MLKKFIFGFVSLFLSINGFAQDSFRDNFLYYTLQGATVVDWAQTSSATHGKYEESNLLLGQHPSATTIALTALAYNYAKVYLFKSKNSFYLAYNREF